MTATETARVVAALVETLLPGDDGWPPGAVVGVQATLALRLVREHGEDGLARLLASLGDAAATLRDGDAAARVAAVAAWEAREAAFFGFVRDAAYMAYYESPVVAQAINEHGSPYKLMPHVSGYRVPRFDPATDTPTHARGGYIPTDQVRRVAVETLDLDDQRTQNWGRKQ